LLKPFFLVPITRDQELDYTAARHRNIVRDYRFLSAYPATERENLLKLIPNSRSQLRQDLFVLHQTAFKRDGFFVEFGATDGKQFSNTLLLAEEFSWQGILAEPAKIWHSQLRQNRPEATIETRCVWKLSGQRLQFAQTSNPELSALSHINNQDVHTESRRAF
jgi:hypothetical protein